MQASRNLYLKQKLKTNTKPDGYMDIIRIKEVHTIGNTVNVINYSGQLYTYQIRPEHNGFEKELKDGGTVRAYVESRGRDFEIYPTREYFNNLGNL